MPPRLRIRGPKKAVHRVSYSTEIRLESGKQYPRLHVHIKLPSKTLNRLNHSLQEKKCSKGDNNKILSEDILDSELSSLDIELNKALDDDSSRWLKKSSIVTDNNGSKTTEPAGLSEPSAVKLERNVEQDFSSPSYKIVPGNLISMLEAELGSMDTLDNDSGEIQKIVFSLKDPLSAGKIKLPVKSFVCHHFECFDFENFCIFNKIPPGVKTLIKKDLAKKSLELKKSHKQASATKFKKDKMMQAHLPSLNLIDLPCSAENYTKNYKAHFLPPKIPVYKCPVCNSSFELNQLFISDIFNFFVKTTPANVTRIELQDITNYRLLEDSVPAYSTAKKMDQPHEVILLSDESESDSEDMLPSPRKTKGKRIPPDPTEGSDFDTQNDDDYNPEELDIANWLKTDEIFDDGLDEELIRLSNLGTSDHFHGKGSWEDPVTLD